MVFRVKLGVLQTDIEVRADCEEDVHLIVQAMFGEDVEVESIKEADDERMAGIWRRMIDGGD